MPEGSKRRVTFLCDRFSIPAKQGVQDFYVNWMRLSATSGIEVDLYAMQRPCDELQMNLLRQHANVTLRSTCTSAASFYGQLPRNVFKGLASSRYGDKAHIKYFKSVFGTQAPPLNQTIFICGLTFLPLLPIFKKYNRVIFSPIDAYSLRFSRIKSEQRTVIGRVAIGVKERLARFMEMRWLKDCDECQVFGTACRDHLLSLLPDLSVSAVPLTIDESKVARTLNINERLYDILFSGNLDLEYIRAGVASFLNAPEIEVLLRSYPKLKIAIHSPSRNALAELERTCKLDQVVFLGHVEDYFSLIQQSRILIFPDEGGTGLKSRVVLGAALKKPIVGTHWVFEGLPLQDRRDCFIGRTSNELIEGLTLLLESPNLQESMGYNAEKQINQFCGAVQVRKQWENLLFPAKTS